MAYLDDLRASIAEHQRIIDSGAKEAPQAQQIINQFQNEIERVQSSANPGGGGNDSTYDPDAYAKQQVALAEQRRTINAVETLRGLMTDYGLSSLMGKIEEYVKQGYEADAVMALIRTTPEYKQRFPAMEALAKKQRAISEAAYIEYERTAAQLEQRYGFPTGLLMNSVTDLLTNEVSSAELNDRAIMASAASIEAPQELKDTLQQYYNIDQGGLAAYFLDPDLAIPLLQKQYASSVIGTEATRQGIGIDVAGAENLQALGVTQEQARTGFGNVARMGALSQGRGDIASQQQLISGTFAQDEQSLKAIERAQKARVGQFAGGGSYAGNQQGITGLASAATR